MHQVYSFVECEVLFIKQKSLIERKGRLLNGPDSFWLWHLNGSPSTNLDVAPLVLVSFKIFYSTPHLMGCYKHCE